MVKSRKGMSLCHVTKAEIDGFDALQGMPLIDEKTGFREYPLLAKIIEMPGVKDIFYHVRDEIMGQGKPSPDLEHIYKKAKEFTLPFEEAPGEKENPTKQLSKEGTPPDDHMAWLPDNVVQFMLELEDKEPSFNPKDGLLQFGWNPFKTISNFVSAPFKAVSKVANVFTGGRGNEIMRWAGTIGGALLGGPMGAGIGNALASYGTGKGFGQSAWSGLKNYGLTTGLQGAGQMLGMGSATPYTGGFFAGSNPLVSGYYDLMGKSGLAASTAPTMGQVAANAASPAVAGTQVAAPGMLSGLMSNPIVPLAAMGLLTHQADKKHHAHDKEQYERERKEQEEHKHRIGYYNEWKRPNSRLKRKWVENPKYVHGGNDEPYYLEEYEKEPHRFKTGGKIKKIQKAGFGGALREVLHDKEFLKDIKGHFGYKAAGHQEPNVSEVQNIQRKWVENPKYVHGGNNEPYYLESDIIYKLSPNAKKQEFESQEIKRPGNIIHSKKFKAGGALKSFTESTGIKGPGNGQDDAIKTSMPAGTYIIDATSTAHLGDGSSECGIKALKKTTKEIRSKYSPLVIKEVEKMLKSHSQNVPVYVANDEFKIDPVTVYLQGEGSLKQGAKDFKKMVKNIRIHKASNGLGLPPAAKTPLQYLNMR